MISIRELIEHPSMLSQETLPALKEMVDDYPFFQIAWLLYVQNLYAIKSERFAGESKRASGFLPDRRALFLSTGGDYLTRETARNLKIETGEEEQPAERTQSVIDVYLEDNQNGDASDTVSPTVSDLTTDYASFLIKQSETTPPPPAQTEKKTAEPAPALKGAQLIDSFIEETKGKMRLAIQENENSEFVSPSFSPEDEEIYTESMVNIYIKQGRYKQALETLRKISLIYPNKSSTFAAQMHLLEIIAKMKAAPADETVAK